MKQRSLRNRISLIGVGQLFNSFVNILLLPYLARSLDVEVYGTYGQVLMISGIFQAVFAFGLPSLILNYLNKKNPVDRDNFVTNSFFSCLILSTVGVLILVICNQQIAQLMNNNSLVSLLNIYALSILFNLFSNVLISILNHFHRVKSITYVVITNNLMRVAIIISLIQFSYGLDNIFIGLLVLAFIQFIILLVLSPIPLLNGRFQLNTLKKILSKGLPLGLSGITTLLLIQTDGVMISALIDTSAYALYRMGAIPIPFLFILYSSVISVTGADINKYFHLGEYNRILSIKRKTSFGIALLTYPALIIILVFAKQLIDIYLGDQYQGSLWVFVIYNFLLFLRITDYRDLLIAAGKTKVILLTDLSIFIFNVIVNYILISSFGIIGAVIASILSFYALSVLLHYQTAKLIRSSMLSFFEYKKMIRMVMLALILAVLSYLIFKAFNASFYLIPFIVLFYFIGVYYSIIKFKIASVDQLIAMISQYKILSPISNVLKRL